MKRTTLVFNQKQLVDHGDLNYLTNCAGDENTISGKLGKNIASPAAWKWIEQYWGEDYGCFCYGATFFGKPGILLCEERYPESCTDLLPDGAPVFADLPKRLALQCTDLYSCSELAGCTLFVMCDTDAACNGDPCHEMCCFIPVDLPTEVTEVIQFFCNQMISTRS